MATESKRKANAKYDREHTTGVFLKLNKETDKDILEKLSSVPNRQGYIKDLIRKDLSGTRSVPDSDSVPEKTGCVPESERNNMTYRIKPEFIDLWGSDATFETVLTEDDIRFQAEESDMPFEELMKQVYPNTPSEVSWYATMIEKGR